MLLCLYESTAVAVCDLCSYTSVVMLQWLSNCAPGMRAPMHCVIRRTYMSPGRATVLRLLADFCVDFAAQTSALYMFCVQGHCARHGAERQGLGAASPSQSCQMASE
eukprot:GHRR01036805.1.p2 GENE.GHRR01036805.1~~GHRR01036805.1.p2  ORF type:complete len:107 (+),score=14.11 GHRR01036805.1:78-398(+)